ncbi:hypothetical protein [Nocardia mangyaensis]|uniref:hypothetical protein n=1 Tax=Nocardia mangyaensis TaxID=2213200 RepID=UPI002675067F|nr:hypothetical protein [Nocardia mangyaensis]MDO3647198.1 hypothetical protein [Nocardia mangyaensis]
MGSDALSPDQGTLDELRRRMASIPGRGESVSGRIPREQQFRRDMLPVPAPLVELLPDGGLPKGAVIAYSGAHSLLTGLLAEVTAHGGHAAVIGLPRLGLLAAAEMGAQLSRLAVIADPGPDPAEVAAVLLDGLDLVVLGLGGLAVPPARCRVLAARARNRGATLVVAGGEWTNPSLRLDSRVTGYRGLGPGCGRLRSVCLDVRVSAKAGPPRHGHIDLCARSGRTEWQTRETVRVAEVPALHEAVS